MSVATAQESQPAAARTTVRADRLRYHMMVRGLTSTHLADKSGLSGATISHCLNGHRISPSTLKKICLVLALVPPVDLADDLIG